MLQLLGGRWERNPAAEQRICGAQASADCNKDEDKNIVCIRHVIRI